MKNYEVEIIVKLTYAAPSEFDAAIGAAKAVKAATETQLYVSGTSLNSIKEIKEG